MDPEDFHRLPQDVQDEGMAWFARIAPGRYTTTVQRVDADTLRVATLPMDPDALAAVPVVGDSLATDDIDVPAASCPPRLLAVI